MAGHVAPEAVRVGPIAAVKTGDTRVLFDIPKRQLNLELSAKEIKARLKKVKQPAPRYTHGSWPNTSHSSAWFGAITTWDNSLPVSPATPSAFRCGIIVAILPQVWKCR